MIVPDYRAITYSNDLYHYGIPRRSGRYPWGSGDRPKQRLERRKEREERRKEREERQKERMKNKLEGYYKIGSERLQNRIKKANDDADRLSRKIGWKNTKEAGKAYDRVKDIKGITNEILSDEGRVMQVGKHTKRVRIANAAITSSAIAAVSGLGSYALVGAWGCPLSTLAIPIGAGIAIGKKGYDYYKKTTY